MSFGDKVIDLFMPTKKESRQNSEPTVNKQKPEVEDFTKLIDRDSLHSLFPFSWEQYPTYVQSGENFIRVLAIADYPKRVYGNWSFCLLVAWVGNCQSATWLLSWLA